MKFVCAKVNDSSRVGVILGDEVALLPEPWTDLVTLIEG